ncbi:hypothetical protein E4L96_12605 [Massilia arenosa]|uniref:STAS/SEC14 domain-containing protein n=1 Tax=Zemynaea arenosa TaxID=2561931 RepID=A0A4Y9SAC7_9BURK|nr:hypothetical protein [Massilia arenosa]TFW18829.1 hypothetical protein E4L96_12605 [Massilia arenosa]
MERHIINPNCVALRDGSASFTFIRLKPGLLRVDVRGVDAGQFGTATLDELRMEVMRYQPLELYIHTDDSVSVTVPVAEEWTRFFAQHRTSLKRVWVYAGSKLMNLTVAIAQHRSQTGNLIQIFSDSELFEDALQRALA